MAVHTFNSDGVEIAFEQEGSGEPILLIHGFASNAIVNWRDTDWFRTLTDAGRRVVAIDNRGHGESQKLYDPARYEAPTMAEDASRLLDHLRIECADVMGYSMGARIAAFLAIKHPKKVRSLVFGGLAAGMITGLGGAEEIAQALEAPTAAAVRDPGARGFRQFAERTRSDLKALAACMRASRVKIAVEQLAQIAAPVLVVAGEKDELAGDPAPLVTAIPGARGVVLAGRNHMTAVGDKAFKQAVLDFLSTSSA